MTKKTVCDRVDLSGMPNEGVKRLCAAILHKAVMDIRQNIQPIVAYRFLQGPWAGSMFDELDMDQDRICAEMKSAAYARYKDEKRG